jgi:hypothetical protein
MTTLLRNGMATLRLCDRARLRPRSAARNDNRQPPPYTAAMNLKDAATVAKEHISDLFAAETPQNVRLEGFLYDDHLMVWSLTIGFARPGDADGQEHRVTKIVRVSEVNKSVLSVRDP